MNTFKEYYKKINEQEDTEDFFKKSGRILDNTLTRAANKAINKFNDLTSGSGLDSNKKVISRGDNTSTNNSFINPDQTTVNRWYQVTGSGEIPETSGGESGGSSGGGAFSMTAPPDLQPNTPRPNNTPSFQLPPMQMPPAPKVNAETRFDWEGGLSRTPQKLQGFGVTKGIKDEPDNYKMSRAEAEQLLNALRQQEIQARHNIRRHQIMKNLNLASDDPDVGPNW